MTTILAVGALLLTTPLASQGATIGGAPSAAAATGTASITGTVTGAGSGPLKSVVGLYSTAGQQLSTVKTNAAGVYVFSGVAAGSYTMGFFPNNFEFALQTWWKNKPRQETATFFDITDGQVAKDLNIVINKATQINGTVRGADGLIPAAMEVHAYAADGKYAGTASTNGAGRFHLILQSSGSFSLQFVVSSSDSQYAQNIWWDNKPTRSLSEKITVASGASVDGLQMVLPLGSSISGTIRGAGSSAPIGQASVSVYNSDGEAAGYATSTDGRFTVDQLPAGTYKLQVYNTHDPAYVNNSWFNGKLTQASADAVVVSVGQAVTGKDAVLPFAGSIVGRLTGGGPPAAPLAKIGVVAYLAGSATPVASTNTDATGIYRLTGLRPGSYQLKFVTYSDAAFPASTWYGKSAVQQTAAVIRVEAGVAVTGKNAVVPSSATLTGRVTDAAGVGIPGITVPIWPVNITPTSQNISLAARTDSDGRYTITRVGPGSYMVGFTDTIEGNTFNGTGGHTHQDEFYKNASTLSSATPVTLTGGGSTTADAALSTLKALTTTPVPLLTGTAKVGQKLTSVAGTWAPGPVTLTYQWLADGVPISGATSASHNVRETAVGKKISVRVTGKRAGYGTVSMTSAPTVKAFR